MNVQLKASRVGKKWSFAAIDLFAGAGGLSLGLKYAGFDVIGAVELDRLATEAYRFNHPDVHLVEGDIRCVSPRKLLRELRLRPGELSLLAACPPCQGFSTMRTLNGHRLVHDPQNDLLFEVLRFAEVLRPQAVMLENVPALLKDLRFERFKTGMEQKGYLLNSGVLNAADFGVPQSRRRAIVLAGLGFQVDFAARCNRRATVRDAIGALPQAGASGDPAHDVVENRSQSVQEIIQAIPRDGGSRTSLPRYLSLRCHEVTDGFRDVYGRMAWDKPSPTITGGCVNPSKGRFLHPEEDRCITLREASMLQGFPPDYFWPVARGKFPVARLIGNALPPEFIKRHADSIKDAIQKRLRCPK